MNIGLIKSFNGQFGFIKSENGDVYFHKSVIKSSDIIEKGDEVEYKVEPSKKKIGSYQANEITLIKKAERKEKIWGTTLIGAIKWFDADKGFGIIRTLENKDYFLHNSNYHSEIELLEPGNIFVFQEKHIKNKSSAVNCRFACEYEDFLTALKYLSLNDRKICPDE